MEEQVFKYRHCKHERHLYNQNQHWCAVNGDISHCDENCPLRDEEEIVSTIVTYTSDGRSISFLKRSDDII